MNCMLFPEHSTAIILILTELPSRVLVRDLRPNLSKKLQLGKTIQTTPENK